MVDSTVKKDLCQAKWTRRARACWRDFQGEKRRAGLHEPTQDEMIDQWHELWEAARHDQLGEVVPGAAQDPQATPIMDPLLVRISADTGNRSRYDTLARLLATKAPHVAPAIDEYFNVLMALLESHAGEDATPVEAGEERERLSAIGAAPARDD